ncbi:unnamed protein product, partial [Choristocarpus tenellus]
SNLINLQQNLCCYCIGGSVPLTMQKGGTVLTQCEVNVHKSTASIPPSELATLVFDIVEEDWLDMDSMGYLGEPDRRLGFTGSVGGLGDLCNDHSVAKLLARLCAGEVVETKAFLRPIFKWCKKGGGKDNRNIDQAFFYAEWLAALSKDGDVSLGLPAQPHLRPSYAFNAIITACQRSKADKHAKRAYVSMLRHGHSPDVFTHTALIDVLGRAGDLKGALRVYSFMKNSPAATETEPGLGVRPNAITYATAIRVGSLHPDSVEGVRLSLSVLDDAEVLLATEGDDGKGVDVIVYNAALSVATRNEADLVAGRVVLERMKGWKVHPNEHTINIVARLLGAAGWEAYGEKTLEMWVQEGLLSEHMQEEVRKLQDFSGTADTTTGEAATVIAEGALQVQEDLLPTLGEEEWSEEREGEARGGQSEGINTGSSNTLEKLQVPDEGRSFSNSVYKYRLDRTEALGRTRIAVPDG